MKKFLIIASIFLGANQAKSDEPASMPVRNAVDKLLGRAPVKKTYQQAVKDAITHGKPLVVWTGKAICPTCIRENSLEFEHYFTSSAGNFPNDSLIIAMPVNGKLMKVGQVSEWPDGHIPTIRHVIYMWRTTPITQRKLITTIPKVEPTGTAPKFNSTIPVSKTYFQPIQYYRPVQYQMAFNPMPFFSGGGGCST